MPFGMQDAKTAMQGINFHMLHEGHYMSDSNNVWLYAEHGSDDQPTGLWNVSVRYPEKHRESILDSNMVAYNRTLKDAMIIGRALAMAEMCRIIVALT